MVKLSIIFVGIILFLKWLKYPLMLFLVQIFFSRPSTNMLICKSLIKLNYFFSFKMAPDNCLTQNSIKWLCSLFLSADKDVLILHHVVGRRLSHHSNYFCRMKGADDKRIELTKEDKKSGHNDKRWKSGLCIARIFCRFSRVWRSPPVLN